MNLPVGQGLYTHCLMVPPLESRTYGVVQGVVEQVEVWLLVLTNTGIVQPFLPAMDQTIEMEEELFRALGMTDTGSLESNWETLSWPNGILKWNRYACGIEVLQEIAAGMFYFGPSRGPSACSDSLSQNKQIPR